MKKILSVLLVSVFAAATFAGTTAPKGHHHGGHGHHKSAKK